MIQIRLSLWSCLWAAPFFLVACGLFAYALIVGFSHLTDSLTQVVVPGKASLNLQHGRTYQVFLEDQSVVNGEIYSSNQPVEGLVCRVNSVQDGSEVALRSSSSNTSYSVNGRSGHSVLEFLIQKDGEYDFACDYGQRAGGPRVVVAVGSVVGEKISRMVFSGLVELFGGIAAGLLVIDFVVVRRVRAKKRLWQSSQFQGPQQA
jgi:hypothetical protein